MDAKRHVIAVPGRLSLAGRDRLDLTPKKVRTLQGPDLVAA